MILSLIDDNRRAITAAVGTPRVYGAGRERGSQSRGGRGIEEPGPE